MSSTQGWRQRRLCLEELERRDTPSTIQIETFDTTPVGVLPSGWTQWASSGNAYVTSSAKPYSGPNGLASNTASNVSSRAWQAASTPADTAASAHIYSDSLIPTEVVARGQNLNGNSPTFYAASIIRGIKLQLIKSVNGTRTVLGTAQSTNYVSNTWLKVTLQPSGDQIKAEVINTATGQYLNASGGWQTAQTFALTISDTAIAADGFIGINRPAQYAGTVSMDNFTAGKPDLPTIENFESTTIGGMPASWQRYTEGNNQFAVASGPSGGNVLMSGGTTAKRAYAWLDSATGATNGEVTSSVYLNSATPAILLARGSGLNTATPTYYGVQVSSGLQLQLVRMVNGTSTVLANSGSMRGLVNVWVKLTINVQGSQLRVRVQRVDTNQYLSSGTTWVTGNTWFRELTDTAIASGVSVGVGRERVAGSAIFDDVTLSVPATDTVIPTVAINSPNATDVLSGIATVSASASDDVGVNRVEFWINNSLKSTVSTALYNWSFDTTSVPDGSYTLTVKSFDAVGNVGIATRTLTIVNTTTPTNPPTNPPGGPTFPQHYTHIRIASLAYSGTPMTSFETGLLQNSIDLVVPNPAFLGPINSVSANTPQLIYTNVSNLYEGLLTDWLNYADAHALDREAAFYHVAQATNFSGSSPSSQPVSWLWSVTNGATDYTSAARSSATNDVPFGSAVNSKVLFGYPDKFRELNFTISTAASAGWSGVFEYATAVDASGSATAWSTLPINSNATSNFTQSGRVTFDPPADWVAAVGTSTTRYFYVRVRTLTAGTAPIATTVLGRDYVNANGATSGVIPAFDPTADQNGDGYLNDAEYANRVAGKDARFRYESRLFYPAYGQMRFAINPSSAGVKSWAADMHVRILAANPLADGLFVDNSNGKSPLEGAVVVESASTYASDYAQMLQAVSTAVAPKWLMANTTGGGTYTDVVVQAVPASMEEFALRPMNTTWSRFYDMAGLVTSRLSQTNAPYLVLDSHPQGGDVTDPRTQMGTLAYYYLLGDPVRTLLMFYGGYEPGTSWTRHWVPAAAFNIGQPTGTWGEFASGSDPANASLTYKIFARNYANALVLYKPLSYKSGVGTGTTADNTATTHALSAAYRALQADGSLGPIVTSITLRNGEGAILIRV